MDDVGRQWFIVQQTDLLERCERFGWQALLKYFEREYMWPALYAEDGGEA